MPIKLEKGSGLNKPLQHLKYLPFYYFIPKSFLQRSGMELNSIPRTTRELFQSSEALAVLESDLYALEQYTDFK